MFNLQVAKEDIKNGLYRISEDEKFGDYDLFIACERGDVVISLSDWDGVASSKVSEEHFLSLNEEGFNRLLGEILAYNLIPIEN